MALLAGVALVSSVLGVGLDGLITFGVLLGSPTVVFLGGMGSTTFTRDYVRADLGQHVRTCAGDYPGTAAPLARR